MFNHILVPLDGSPLAENVLPHVIAIAKSGEDDVILLRVIEPQVSSGSAGDITRPRPVDPLEWQIRKAEAETYLNDVAKRLHQAGINTSVHLSEGRAAENIIEFSQENQAGLIIISSHGASGMSGWNISSVVQKIVMRARTSLMITRAYRPSVEATSAESTLTSPIFPTHSNGNLSSAPYQRILVPLDGSQRAEVILSLAATLARSQQAHLLLVHVVSEPEIPRRTPPSREDVELANRLTERNRIEASHYLSELATRLDIPSETRIIVSSNASSTLHSLVSQDKIDLVIMSAHGYTGGSQWPYGNVVNSFITYGVTPLLILQDLPADRFEPSLAELAAREIGGH